MQLGGKGSISPQHFQRETEKEKGRKKKRGTAGEEWYGLRSFLVLWNKEDTLEDSPKKGEWKGSAQTHKKKPEIFG